MSDKLSPGELAVPSSYRTAANTTPEFHQIQKSNAELFAKVNEGLLPVEAIGEDLLVLHRVRTKLTRGYFEWVIWTIQNGGDKIIKRAMDERKTDYEDEERKPRGEAQQAVAMTWRSLQRKEGVGEVIKRYQDAHGEPFFSFVCPHSLAGHTWTEFARRWAEFEEQAKSDYHKYAAEVREIKKTKKKTPTPPPQPWKLCITNPNVWKMYTEIIQEHLAAWTPEVIPNRGSSKPLDVNKTPPGPTPAPIG